MINKIFVIGGLCTAAILIIENMVTGMPAYVLIDSGSSTYMLSVVSVIVGVFIGYGARGLLQKDAGDDENLDF